MVRRLPILLLLISVCCCFNQLPNAEISGRSFIDQVQIVSNYLTQQYEQTSEIVCSKLRGEFFVPTHITEP